jgi:hypothetical protein
MYQQLDNPNEFITNGPLGQLYNLQADLLAKCYRGYKIVVINDVISLPVDVAVSFIVGVGCGVHLSTYPTSGPSL